MANAIKVIIALVLAACCLVAAAFHPPAPTAADKQRAESLLAATPLLFHSAAEQVYVARSPQLSVQVHGAGFALARPSQTDALTVDLVGASSTAQPAGEQRHGDAVVNYIRGSDASQWRSGVPVWERVRVANTYDGIDVVYYTAASGQLEFDFVLQPGADHRRIGMRFAAAWSLAVDSDGSLTATHPAWGSLTLPRPVIYQPLADHSQSSVDGGYALIDDNVAGFWLGDYDAALPLVIDPLVFSTFIGGSNDDFLTGLAIDSAGNVAITGYTASDNFPVTEKAYDPLYAADYDVFVSKFSASGALVFSTYLGGTGEDLGYSVACDSAGNVVVVGSTLSGDFPTTVSSSGGVFLAKFSSSGAVLFSQRYDSISFNGVTTDSADNILVAGFNGNDALVLFFNKDGKLTLALSFGGTGVDFPSALATDSADNIVVTGYTSSDDFKTTDGTKKQGGQDVFVIKFDASDPKTLFSSLLGGSGDDLGRGIATDSADNIVVTGQTNSNNFPAKDGKSFQGGKTDAFVSKFNANGELLFSTCLGGSGGENGAAVAIDSADNFVVVGVTSSGNFPTTADAFSGKMVAAGDAFVSKFNAKGELVYSTYLGGSGDDVGQGVGVDRLGNIYVGGRTSSDNFPVTGGAYASLRKGLSDAFVSVLFDCSAVNDCSSHGACTGPNQCRCDFGWTSAADCSQGCRTTSYYGQPRQSRRAK